MGADGSSFFEMMLERNIHRCWREFVFRIGASTPHSAIAMPKDASPCRRALRAERALPCGIRGPVLRPGTSGGMGFIHGERLSASLSAAEAGVRVRLRLGKGFCSAPSMHKAPAMIERTRIACVVSSPSLLL
jgi:hypothetical protein